MTRAQRGHHQGKPRHFSVFLCLELGSSSKFVVACEMTTLVIKCLFVNDQFRLAGAERRNFPTFYQDPFSGSMGDHPDLMTSAFFAAKGTLVRSVGDKVVPWYLKWWGTPGERAEYALGQVYRAVVENPKATVAGLAAVTGGLFYYWYRTRQRSPERIVEDAVLKAMNSTNLTEEMEKEAGQLEKFIASRELQAARTVVMEAAVEGECILANTYSKEVVGKETLVQLLRKNDQAKDAELAPLTARCHGKVAELSWNGPTKVLGGFLIMLNDVEWGSCDLPDVDLAAALVEDLWLRDERLVEKELALGSGHWMARSGIPRGWWHLSGISSGSTVADFHAVKLGAC
eukprot:Skav214039  [mRNA]  locus=scaffold2017:32786:40542:+ [translate_table: standard]